MTIRIVNKTGLGNDTKVFNDETGEEIKGISKIEIDRIHPRRLVAATLYFSRVELELNAEWMTHVDLEVMREITLFEKTRDEKHLKNVKAILLEVDRKKF